MANIKKKEANNEISKKSASREEAKGCKTLDSGCWNPVDMFDDCGCAFDDCGCMDTCMCC